MRYHEISPVPKLLVRRSSAEASLEHAGILAKMEKAGWIRPVHVEGKPGKNRYDFFSFSQLERAVRRMEREKLPD
jgi:hypothetical protein